MYCDNTRCVKLSVDNGVGHPILIWDDIILAKIQFLVGLLPAVGQVGVKRVGRIRNSLSIPKIGQR